MSAPLPRHFRLLLSGLVWTVLLHGAFEAFRMGPTVLALYAGVVLAAAVRWGRKPDVEHAAGQASWTGAVPLAGALARAAERRDEPLQRNPLRRKAQPNPSQRTLGARMKIWVASLGLVLCGLLWLLVATLFFLPDPAPAVLNVNTGITLITISMLLTVLCGVVLRSGLRGPADPLAPDESRTTPGDVLPLNPQADYGMDSGYPRRKKSHLRLVRPTP